MDGSADLDRDVLPVRCPFPVHPLRRRVSVIFSNKWFSGTLDEQ